VPVLLLAFVWPVDRVSVATMAVTIPLIPVFMILIGLSAQAATRRQWLTLSLLGAHFLDVLQGLPTSALALEMLATLSVALVAVGIGLRLVSGGMRFESGLMVLLLAPEVYLPLRQVGSHFHASTEGMEAAARVFEVLEQPLPAAGTAAAPDPAGARSVSRRSRSPTRAGRVLSWTA
jgi:ABC-type transport system involved in cytochrome bd biosynthesis fused ATPase/permease subunit